MIEMYKILSGKYDTDLIPRVNREHGAITRGNFECNLFDARPATENVRSDGVDEPGSLYTST